MGQLFCTQDLGSVAKEVVVTLWSQGKTQNIDARDLAESKGSLSSTPQGEAKKTVRTLFISLIKIQATDLYLC